MFDPLTGHRNIGFPPRAIQRNARDDEEVLTPLLTALAATHIAAVAAAAAITHRSSSAAEDVTALAEDKLSELLIAVQFAISGQDTLDDGDPDLSDIDVKGGW